MRTTVDNIGVTRFKQPTSQKLFQKSAAAVRERYRMFLSFFRTFPYRRITLVTGTVILFFIISLSLFLWSLPTPKNGAPAVAASAPTLEATIHDDAPPTEINIARTGLILLRGAQVVAIDGPMFTVRTHWGSAGFTWTVHANATRYETRTFGTRFMDYKGERISPENFRVGDFVTIGGTLDTSMEQPTVNADSVRLLK